MKRDATLAKAEAAVERATKNLRVVAKARQAKCKHPVVVGRPAGNPYRYIDTYWQEARVCPACGLFEEGHYGTFKKLKTEAVVMKDFNYPIYSHRVSTEG